VSIKFLTEELGFESYLDAFQFLSTYLKDDNAEGAINHDDFLLETRSVAAIFERAKAAASKLVDIKGQI
jgi:hypothetical protein